MKNILLVGVGGQGILLASEVLSEAALRAGMDVKKSEVHGMSQRGGAVNSHVRYGERVFSPLIPAGGADFIVALEKLEALRAVGWLAPDGVLVANDFRLDPAPVASGKLAYPEDALETLRQELDGRLVTVDGPRLALEAGDLRAMNVVLLGALSRLLDLPGQHWTRSLEAQVKPRFLELNRRAFELGREAAAAARS